MKAVEEVEQQRQKNEENNPPIHLLSLFYHDRFNDIGNILALIKGSFRILKNIFPFDYVQSVIVVIEKFADGFVPELITQICKRKPVIRSYSNLSYDLPMMKSWNEPSPQQQHC